MSLIVKDSFGIYYRFMSMERSTKPSMHILKNILRRIPTRVLNCTSLNE